MKISLEVLPEAERDRPLDAYWRRILSDDAAVHGPAARAATMSSVSCPSTHRNARGSTSQQ